MTKEVNTVKKALVKKGYLMGYERVNEVDSIMDILVSYDSGTPKLVTYTGGVHGERELELVCANEMDFIREGYKLLYGDKDGKSRSSRTYVMSQVALDGENTLVIADSGEQRSSSLMRMNYLSKEEFHNCIGIRVHVVYTGESEDGGRDYEMGVMTVSDLREGENEKVDIANVMDNVVSDILNTKENLDIVLHSRS